jgi:hypothetical protein
MTHTEYLANDYDVQPTGDLYIEHSDGEYKGFISYIDNENAGTTHITELVSTGGGIGQSLMDELLFNNNGMITIDVECIDLTDYFKRFGFEQEFEDSLRMVRHPLYTR